MTHVALHVTSWKTIPTKIWYEGCTIEVKGPENLYVPTTNAYGPEKLMQVNNRNNLVAAKFCCLIANFIILELLQLSTYSGRTLLINDEQKW